MTDLDDPNPPHRSCPFQAVCPHGRLVEWRSDQMLHGNDVIEPACGCPQDSYRSESK